VGVGRVLVGLAVVLIAAACMPAAGVAQHKSISAQSIALQPGDVTGLQRCAGSGDVRTVVQEEKAISPTVSDEHATEWEQWRTRGATEAYYAFYGKTAADCDALTVAGLGAPTGGLMAGLVVKFKDEAVAARTFRAGSTLLGFGPKDITFIKLVGGSVTTGPDTGLGPESVVGAGRVTGATYYFAFWQNKAFDSFLIAYDLAFDDADGATRNVNQRMATR
jgi:hypothetical protein